MKSDLAWDAVVIGAGFFGVSVALLLKERGLSVVVLEQERKLMTRASYNNQARVHGGYHYPRSLMTAQRSRINFPRFVQDYSKCIKSDFEQFYAIGAIGSRVSARQFVTFMGRIGAPLQRAPAHILKLFNPNLVEAVFATREYAFDADLLAEVCAGQLEASRTPVWFETEADRAGRTASGRIALAIRRNGEPLTLDARWIFNCTYSQLNRINLRSSLPIIPLRHELTEMALVEPPPVLADRGITVMCGPFFSLMPFPPRCLHTLSHVRYTPHCTWSDGDAETYVPPLERFERMEKKSAFEFMLRDSMRLMPCLAECLHKGSLWEVKTVLPLNDIDDGRPILFRPSPELPGLVHLMGGKIDNIYDIPQELETLLHGS
jgi:glycine/D-amino acid oxidase-like deaminating enzyme